MGCSYREQSIFNIKPMSPDQWNSLTIASGQFIIPALCIPVIIGLWKWKDLNQPMKKFSIYLLVFFLINIFDLVYVLTAERYLEFFEPWLAFTNFTLTFSLIAYQLNTFILLGLFFTYLFPKPSDKMIIKVVSVGLAILVVITYILEQGWRNYGIIGPISEAGFCFIIPLIYLWHLSRRHLGIPLYKNPYFLISLGLILPNLIGFILFLLGNFILEHQPILFYQLSLLNNIFLVLSITLFSFAFWRSNPNYLG